LIQLNHTFKVHLFSERGLDFKHASEVAAWFQRSAGPVSVDVIRRPVKVPLSESGDILWPAAFQKLRELRVEVAAPPEAFVYLLTASPNEYNWYAVEDEEYPRNGFGHVGDFSWVTSAPAHAISTHYIQKTIFNALLKENNIPLEDLWHEEPRGCMFDFCAYKEQLNLKLRTADICAECMSAFRDIRVPDALIQQTVSIMESARRLAVNTAPYLPPEPAFANWPFPVAITRHKVVQATNPLLRFLLLLDHFDSLVRYFYLAKEAMAGRQPRMEERPSMGWWLDQLAHSLKGETSFREVVRIAQQEKVVSIRNERRGHGWMAPDSESYRGDAEHLESVLTKIENELAPFLENYHLVIPREVNLCDGKFVIEGDHLIGSHILHPPFKTSLEDLLDSGITQTTPAQVYLADSHLSRFWNVSSYIRSAVCPECRHARILIADGGRQFIDVLMGHRVQLA
jgi:hypothetical protein